MGKEGSHAAMSSDYVLHRFWHLKSLLFLHGRYSHFRTTKVVFFCFYKNMCMPLPQFFFAFSNGASGQTLYDSALMAIFNVCVTSLPPLFAGLFEKDVPEDVLLQFAQAYDYFKKETTFTTRHFLGWMLKALWHAVVIYFTLFLIYSESAGIVEQNSPGPSLWMMGGLLFLATITQINIQMLHACDYIVKFTILGVIVGVVVFLATFALFSGTYWVTVDPEAYAVLSHIFGTWTTFWYLVCAITLCAMPVATLFYYRQIWHPSTVQQLVMYHKQLEVQRLEHARAAGLAHEDDDKPKPLLDRILHAFNCFY